MVKLRVLAGPNANDLTPISDIVNTYKTHRITSDRFDGEICVHIKGFVGEDGQKRDSAYFKGGKEKGGSGGAEYNNGSRKGVTWSIQVRGRFLEDVSSDDVLFGNTFDRALKLPWGSSAALKFMNYVDPTLEHALDSSKPWALSPLISTMPYFAIRRGSSTPSLEEREEEALTESHGEEHRMYLEDNTSELEDVPRFRGPSQRRTYFSNAEHRKELTYHPEDTITTDFCYGFLTFPELYLNLPGGISFDLNKYWDGQPVRFVCCERNRNGKGPGDPFWVVVFEPAAEEEEEEFANTGTSHGGSDRDSFSTGPPEVTREEQEHLREDID